MSKLLFISDTGLPLGLAIRCSQDGHDVRFLTTMDAGLGLVKLHSGEESWIPDLAVMDSIDRTAEAEDVRSQGFRVLGPSRWSSMLESDANYHKQIITSLGWPTTPIQGTHFHISAFFNGANFIASYGSIIYRRFMAGGAGPDLNCTGMVGNFKGLPPKSYKTFVEPLEKMLRKVGHHGCVHIAAVVHGEQFYVKELNASFANPLTLLLFENTNLSSSEVILRLFDETSKPIYITDKWAAGLKISVPPFPYEATGIPCELAGIVPAALKHIWLEDVSLIEGKYIASGRGSVGYITSRGSDENEAVRRMYRTVGNLKTPDLQYRVDVGRNAQSLLNALRQPGWLE